MGDVEITVHNDEPNEPNEPDEPLVGEAPAPVVVPVVIPAPETGLDTGLDRDELSDLRAELARQGGQLDSIQAFIERIEIAEAIDGNSDEEALDTLAELADREEMEEHESTAEAGETPEADGAGHESDGTAPAGENSRDERPRATHPWWRAIRN